MERPIRKHLSEANLIRIGVPKILQGITIEDFNTYNNKDLKEVKRYIKEYINNLTEKIENNQGLFLYGSNGVGKSMIASLIIKEAYKRRYTARRVTFVDYIKEYTRVWGIKDEEDRQTYEEQFYTNFKAPEVLFLEEVGKELDSKVSPVALEDCLRYREERSLLTGICTNLATKDVIDKYGASIGSLIKGNMTPILLVGSDKRLEQYNERIGD
jgi:DNA replication protein DnaC